MFDIRKFFEDILGNNTTSALAGTEYSDIDPTSLFRDIRNVPTNIPLPNNVPTQGPYGGKGPATTSVPMEPTNPDVLSKPVENVGLSDLSQQLGVPQTPATPSAPMEPVTPVTAAINQPAITDEVINEQTKLNPVEMILDIGAALVGGKPAFTEKKQKEQAILKQKQQQQMAAYHVDNVINPNADPDVRRQSMAQLNVLYGPDKAKDIIDTEIKRREMGYRNKWLSTVPEEQRYLYGSNAKYASQSLIDQQLGKNRPNSIKEFEYSRENPEFINFLQTSRKSPVTVTVGPSGVGFEGDFNQAYGIGPSTTTTRTTGATTRTVTGGGTATERPSTTVVPPPTTPQSANVTDGKNKTFLGRPENVKAGYTDPLGNPILAGENYKYNEVIKPGETEKEVRRKSGVFYELGVQGLKEIDKLIEYRKNNDSAMDYFTDTVSADYLTKVPGVGEKAIPEPIRKAQRSMKAVTAFLVNMLSGQSFTNEQLEYFGSMIYPDVDDSPEILQEKREMLTRLIKATKMAKTKEEAARLLTNVLTDYGLEPLPQSNIGNTNEENKTTNKQSQTETVQPTELPEGIKPFEKVGDAVYIENKNQFNSLPSGTKYLIRLDDGTTKTYTK